MKVTRTLTMITAIPDAGSVRVDSFLQADDQWFHEPRWAKTEEYSGPPTLKMILQDFADCLKDGGPNAGWWKPVPAPFFPNENSE